VRLVPLSRRAGTQSNKMWPTPRSTSVPSGVFIHLAVWPQQTCNDGVDHDDREYEREGDLDHAH